MIEPLYLKLYYFSDMYYLKLEVLCDFLDIDLA